MDLNSVEDDTSFESFYESIDNEDRRIENSIMGNTPEDFVGEQNERFLKNDEKKKTLLSCHRQSGRRSTTVQYLQVQLCGEELTLSPYPLNIH
jgi:hypothetical protein